MAEKKKKVVSPARSTAEDEKDVRGHPETNFLPPLTMFLAFSDRDTQRNETEKDAGKQESSDEKSIERLIEKLSEKDE